MYAIITLLIVHWYLSLFCQSFFLHRYCSHRMFELNPFWKKFFYYLTWISQGPSYLNPRTYSVMHIDHHKYSDQERDPHSPQNHQSVGAMMKHTYYVYMDIFKTGKRHHDSVEDVKLDRFADSWITRVAFGSLYFFFYCYFAPNIYYFLLLPVHWFMGPIHGAIVNWCGHKYGYQNYDNKDFSKNTLFVDLLMMGELYQNNHHQNAKRKNFAHRWYEVDLTYVVMVFLEKVRILRPV